MALRLGAVGAGTHRAAVKAQSATGSGFCRRRAWRVAARAEAFLGGRRVKMGKMFRLCGRNPGKNRAFFTADLTWARFCGIVWMYFAVRGLW